ncbi:cell division protein ZapA [Maricaulis parjimensis]|uniref:cell division protein ZapA n=1 Tax=Maricaulis parjimensis TaxID=144023 RepID=UPI00193A584D|nr:cell division protein ZapA [Maricaulis parjimensis]
MSKVSVILNGREFTIGCEDGQEAYLKELAQTLDRRVSTIASQVGQIGDLRLLLMAALMLVDEQKDAERRVEALESHVDQLRRERNGSASVQAADRDRLARHVLRIAERLDAFADSLEEGSDAGPDVSSSADLAEARA